MSYDFKKLYQQINNELKNCDINSICNICKLPTSEDTKITLKCNHIYHINCLSITSKTTYISCEYCNKKTKLLKTKCNYIIPKYKKKLEKLEKLYLENKNKYDNLSIKDNNLLIELNNLKEIIDDIKINKIRCKKTTINNKLCNCHFKIKKKKEINDKSKIVDLEKLKDKLINDKNNILELLNQENNEIHICNFKKSNNNFCQNKVKNNKLYCGVHTNKLNNDLKKIDIELNKVINSINKKLNV